MNGLDGIIIDGKVYELSANSDPDVCDQCALANGSSCNAPHWLNCNCIVLNLSQSLTDKLKTTMTDHYVSYEQAVKLKELGFSGEATGKYVDCPNDPILFDGMLYQSWNVEKDEILAPRLDQAQTWLRQEHAIHVSSEPHYVSDYDTYFWRANLTTLLFRDKKKYSDSEYESYEEALSDGIDIALNLLTN